MRETASETCFTQRWQELRGFLYHFGVNYVRVVVQVRNGPAEKRRERCRVPVRVVVGMLMLVCPMIAVRASSGMFARAVIDAVQWRALCTLTLGSPAAASALFQL